MSRFKSLTLFCSAADKSGAQYLPQARDLGAFLASEQITLIYGGGSRGLMGVMANETLKQGGQVHGIIPQGLMDRELAHHELSRLEIVPSLSERKRLMLERGDVIVTMPGGLGTLDELLEAMTWNTLGVFAKPIVLWNINGFWTPFVELLEHLERQGMIHSGGLKQFEVFSSTGDLLKYLSL